MLVTQFGRPLYPIAQAGLHLKWPFQSATYFDRRLRIYNPRPSEFLTRDKKNIVVESYVAWKIEDPDRFLRASAIRWRRRCGCTTSCGRGFRPRSARTIWIRSSRLRARRADHRPDGRPDGADGSRRA